MDIVSYKASKNGIFGGWGAVSENFRAIKRNFQKKIA